ncbi:MAG: hypothetical protein PF541_02035, partial [Prolixibacteraceae bacterium]|nr:hypothetical protein [Prolixibacteraceae bacterium]
YTQTGVASFGIGSFEIVEAIENSQAVFLVKTKVTNYSNVAGMVKYTFQMGGGRRGGGFFGGGGQDRETENRTYLIEAKQTKEIQMVLSEMPNSVIFNTLLSENIPASSMQFGLRSEKDEKRKIEEYEKVIDKQVEFALPGELIVDNDDEGFSIYDPSLENPLRKFVEQQRNKDNDSEFVGQGWGQAPATWSKMADADYYGKIVHSAMVIRSGEGNKTATWKRELNNEGYYDIFVHLKKDSGSGGHRRRGQRDTKGKYVYTVNHADGVEKVELEAKDFENGWNLLGSFYISADSSQVTLSNEGGTNRIVADAVKWVLQR